VKMGVVVDFTILCGLLELTKMNFSILNNNDHPPRSLIKVRYPHQHS